MRRVIGIVLWLAVLPSASWAQAPEMRYHLGLRLRGFERVLEGKPDDTRRAKILAGLKPITFAFLTGQLGRAGQLLDEARLGLSRETISDAERWASSLTIKPTHRLLDTKAKELTVQVGRFYTTKAELPAKPRLRLRLFDSDGKTVTTSTHDLPPVPGEVNLPLTDHKAGDFTLRTEILDGETVLTTSEQTVSRVGKLADRLAALGKARESLTAKERTTDRESLLWLIEQLTLLGQGKTLETAYPAARLLDEVEAGVAAMQAGQAFYGQKKAGEFWLVLATKAGNRVRLQAPPQVRDGKPLPIVFALHGAGGSENLFFDGYGAGLIRKLAAERGWLLVAPLISLRSGLSGEMIDEVARLYPIDRDRVFVVGHSMGAAATMSAVASDPTRFRAVAVLGGGGTVKASDAMKKRPVFVAAGELDVGLPGARALQASLQKAEVATVEYREYKGVEHLTIAQLALRDVFAFFDRALRK